MQTYFALVPDNSTFSIVTVPTKQELLDEAVAITDSQTCSCCTHHAEPAPEDLPGPPPNPPKQPCSKDKMEGQLQDTAAPSGKTTAALDTSAVAPSPKSLAHEVSFSHFSLCDVPFFHQSMLASDGGGILAVTLLKSTAKQPMTSLNPHSLSQCGYSMKDGHW